MLVVDDEPTIRDVVSRYLVRAGYDTTVAATGREALTQADHERPDVVVLDLMLPDVDGLEIDPGARQVRIDGDEIELTQREFELLLFMARHPGQAFTRDQLMDCVWQYSFYIDTSTVTVHIRRLRAKLERDPARPRFIETIWGVGYRFAP